MYDDIIHVAMDQQLLTEIRTRDNYKKLPLWRELQKDINTFEMEQELEKKNELTFDNVFHEPVGFYLIKEFLNTEHNVDKAIFIKDVETYRQLNDPRAREKVGNKIYKRFLLPETHPNYDITLKGSSVFEHSINNSLTNHEINIEENYNNSKKTKTKVSQNSPRNSIEIKKKNDESKDNEFHLSLITENTNSIGIYGRLIKNLETNISNGIFNVNTFDEIYEEVLSDLRLDVFPRFKSQITKTIDDKVIGMEFNNNSNRNLKKLKKKTKKEKLLNNENENIKKESKLCFYEMYLRCKSIENKEITIKDFHQMRMLGRGAFGCVNACKKKDTGKLYAMKQINKKRVQATESSETIMSERNFLAEMESEFVTTLK